MLSATPLSTIIALARAGALEHAWYAFAAAGYERMQDDPAALTVKGRLLKDRAVRARGEDRRLLYLQSAEAYRRAAAVQPGTYPLINAATLSLLSGDRAEAAAIAHEVLERIAREPEEPETPYWRGATLAEALILVGRIDEARGALAEALAAAPQAWEDHASTLRQFILIHEALGADSGWLEMLRPPRSLSWSGETPPPGEIARLIADERIGFGSGGLAAGGELVVAEALLAAGAELHVVLPSDPESFAGAYVDPHGQEWRARFDAALEAAESVQLIRPLGAAPTAESAELAALVAAGAARLNAERLMGEDRRLGEVPSPPPGALALLSISVGSAADEGFDARLREVREVLDGFAGVAVAPHLAGDDILVGFAGAAEAADAARSVHARLRGRMPVRVAGHFGLIPLLRDPFLDAARPTGDGAALVGAIAQATPPDTVCVSLDFAAVLAAGAGAPSGASWIGELQANDGGAPIALYALRPLGSDD
jgi:tetratricopeptide (TPR) repeat protein